MPHERILTGRTAMLAALVLAMLAVAVVVVPTSRATRIDRLALNAQRQDQARIVYPAGRTPVLALPGGGQQAVRSVLNVGHVLRYGDYVWTEAGISPESRHAPVLIRVDLRRQLLSVFRGGDEIGTALILFGAGQHETPRGILKIIEKDENHYSRSYDAPMAYMLRLTTDGIAIHASDVQASAATHGCIGVPTGFARRLFDIARVGDSVVVLASDQAG